MEVTVLIAEVGAFLIILAVLYRYVWPLLRNMRNARQDHIQKQVDDSEEATRKLEDAEKRVESAVEEARKAAARIRDDARADAQRIREELTEQAEREVERIKQRGEEQLLAQRDQLVRRLRLELGGQAMRLAEQVVVESLSDDTRRSATVDHFLEGLDELSGIEGSDSRQAAPSAGRAT